MSDSQDKDKKSGASGHDDHGHAHGHDGHDEHPVELTDSIELGKDASIANLAFGVGAVGIAAGLGLGGGLFGKAFQHSYLAAFMWGLSISVGAIFWLTLQHLVNSKWSVVVRRLGEFLAQGIFVLALLALPILIPIATGNPVLYSWLDHEVAHHLGNKVAYLNKGFFLGRMVFYFGFWFFLAKYWLKKSLAQDGKKGNERSKLQGKSAPSMIVFALSLTFCAIDFLMTLDPIWFSTIFGVYFFATCVLTFHSSLVLFAVWLQKKGHLTSAITQEHYHDIGKMMFAFTAFWSYIGFSQFMLIWYANIPEETHWFHMRLEGTWFSATLILAAVHFVIPFFGMMSRSMKRNKNLLAFWAVWILCVCWFDMYWLVAPNLHKEGMSIGLVDIATWIGVAGILVGAVISAAKSKKLLATGDPRLAKSLAFENI